MATSSSQNGSPLPPDDPRRAAREALRREIDIEVGLLRRRRSLLRSTVFVAVVALVLGLVSPRPPGDVSALLGLADAVEVRSASPRAPQGMWFVESARIEAVSVVTAGGDEVRFLMPSVERTWSSMGDTVRRMTTTGRPLFLSPEDRVRFRSSGLGGEYRMGRVTLDDLSITSAAVMGEWIGREPDEVLGALRRQVVGLGAARPAEVEMLQLASEMMRTYGSDGGRRATMLRVVADIPGIDVTATPEGVTVSIDYVDGDRPLRLSYVFDADTAELVDESLALLASRTEPSMILWRTSHRSERIVVER